MLIIRFLSKILIIIFTAYSIITLLLYFFQDKMIFFPKPVSENTLEQIKKSGNNIKEINLQAKDGTNLHGWFIDNQDREKLLIYFGGNAEEVSHMSLTTDFIIDCSMVLMNYRGYGSSEGKPSEKNFYSDALEIYDYFSKMNFTEIIIMGRSLGTGVAIYLAKYRKADMVICISPYYSLADLAKEKLPFFPIDLILKHKFNSIERAACIKTDLKIIIGMNDKLIPPHHSVKLAENWGGDVVVKEIENADHNSVFYRAEFKDFIRKCLLRK